MAQAKKLLEGKDTLFIDIAKGLAQFKLAEFMKLPEGFGTKMPYENVYDYLAK